jgi:hypothetical protein
MLLRLLKYNTTAGYLLIPLLAVIAWVPSLTSDTYIQMFFDQNPMPLYEILAGYIPHDSLTSKIFSMLLVILSGFYLIRLNNQYLFLPERTLMPAFFLILIVSSLPPLQRFHPALVAMVFFLPAIDRLLASYKTERLSYNFFEASFLIGTGSLFYFNLIWFNIMVWVALLILRPVIWREWVFSILGLAVPWLFLLATDFFLHDSIQWSTGLVSVNFATRNLLSYLSLPDRIFLIFLLLLIILASRTIIHSMTKMKVLSRKIFLLMFWIFAISMVTCIVVEKANVELLVFAAVPVAFLLSHFVPSIRKVLWSNAILWGIVAGMLILAWFPWR